MMKASIALAMALICAYGILLGFRQMESPTPTQIYWKKNRTAVTQYLLRHEWPVVVTGSSLTATLAFNGDARCVYNFGLIGESALTGLDVIAESGEKPKMVFVEINFPGRDVNKQLIGDASGFFARQFPDVNYISPINLAGSLLSNIYNSSRQGASAVNDSVPNQDPELARQRELALQRESQKTLLPPTLIAAKMAEFSAKVEKLEKNGIRVVFFELPVHPELAESNQAVQVRAAFRAAFPKSEIILAEDLSKNLHIKTVDGLHLSADDVRGVLINFRPYYAPGCAGNLASM